MIKNIKTLTADEFLHQQIEKGFVPSCPIRSGERVDFSPNELTMKKLKNTLKGPPKQ